MKKAKRKRRRKEKKMENEEKKNSNNQREKNIIFKTGYLLEIRTRQSINHLYGLVVFIITRFGSTIICGRFSS